MDIGDLDLNGTIENLILLWVGRVCVVKQEEEALHGSEKSYMMKTVKDHVMVINGMAEDPKQMITAWKTLCPSVICKYQTLEEWLHDVNEACKVLRLYVQHEWLFASNKYIKLPGLNVTGIVYDLDHNSMFLWVIDGSGKNKVKVYVNLGKVKDGNI